VKANLRRTDPPKEVAAADTPPQIMDFGGITINLIKYEVRRDGEPIDLTNREFELIKFLAMQPGQVFSREVLMEKVWGYEYIGDVRTVDVTVRRLRIKVEADPDNPKYVVTKRGVGYYFEENA
jgi:two-component system response regulator VicR